MRARRPAVLGSGILLGVLTLITTGYGWYRVETGNFQPVVPGYLYRSGQQGRKHWRAYLQHYGIKSVLNLRGAHPAARWYQQEIGVAAALGVTHYDLRLSATHEVDPYTLETLLTLLRQAPKPLWIHCRSGADRSGLVAALYLLAIESQRAEVAAQQLSLFYGHFPSLFSRTGAMDRSFWRYAHQASLPVGNAAGPHAP
jgi:protein tyrosine/serine phosphatase